jgi:hypothetical protein
MAKEVAGSLLDRKLLQAAANGATGLEMEEQFGVPAAEALIRVKRLLSGQNAFDEIEQRQLSMLSLRSMKEKIEQSGIDVTNPKHIEAYTKTVLAIDRVLGNMSAIDEKQLAIVTEANAKALIRMVETAYGYAMDKLKSEYGDFIDLTVINDAFSEGLRIAAEAE